MTERTCLVCGADLKGDMGRCTNGCCGRCHRRFCTPGGATAPGHGLDLGTARAVIAREQRDR